MDGANPHRRRGSFACFAAAAAIACLAGCLDVSGDYPSGGPSVQATSYEIPFDLANNGGLIVRTCALLGGQVPCADYVNPLGCTTLQIQVDQGANIFYTCFVGSRNVFDGTDPHVLGIPMQCWLDQQTGCPVCFDDLGNQLLDGCNQVEPTRYIPTSYSDDVGLFGEGEIIPPDDGVEDPPEEEPPAEEPCDPYAVIDAYFRELEVRTKVAGISFAGAHPAILKALDSNVPEDERKMDLEAVHRVLMDAWGRAAGRYKKANDGMGICPCLLTSSAPLADDKWCPQASLEVRCSLTSRSSPDRCACDHVFYPPFNEACKAFDPECEDLREAMKPLVGADQTLNHTLYGDGSGLFGRVSGQSWDCQVSPLALDLNGDGLSMSPPTQSVSFDVMASGAAMNVSFPQGGDAWLVLDRDGNGLITDGGELFGDATRLSNFAPASNGFEALGELDQPALGGNGNGIVESGDLLFSELRLWQDANGDGVSQAEELSTLADHEVAGIGLEFDYQGRVRDCYDNDLGLTGRFYRTDRSTGLMVDVYLQNHARR